jgi:CheY-like chemotaxis protein/two-component sensor histidine kinase
VPTEELNHHYPTEGEPRLSASPVEAGRALAEARRASRLKSEFLDQISHRVRTAVQTVRGMSHLLRDGGLSTAQEAYLLNIDKSVEDLFGVVGEALDFSNIEAGSLAIADEDFHLKGALDQELYALHLRAEGKGLLLTCRIDPNTPEVMSGDAPRLAQILAVLVGNAIRYTARGGVELRVTNGGYHNDGRLFLTFSVRDSGPGLSEKQLRALRRMLAAPLTPHLNIPEGLGLGLTVACRLTLLLDGDMTVESGENGAVFTVTLPFREIPLADDDAGLLSQAEPEPGPHFAEPSPLFALKGAKILVVEDDPINRLLIKAILSQVGTETRTAASGAEALSALREQTFAAVLMDVRLPGMDGLETTRRIRALEQELERKRCPILALTARARQGDRGDALRAGMDAYLTKPIDKDELLSQLGAHLTPTALLVADDRHDMLHVLVERGFRVALAETARAALYEAALSHFDLILLDTHFLRQDSLEITKVIRRLEGYSGRRAIIIGVGVDEEAAERCLIGGLNACLPRPFDGDEFAALWADLGHV